MPTDITINDITGQTPYDVYLCDNPLTTCIYINTITDGDIPYTFEVPVIMESQTTFTLKVIDDNECVVEEILTIV
jgi:hypothetical protein